MRDVLIPFLVFVAFYAAIQHFAKPGMFAGQPQTFIRVSYDI